MAAVANSLGPLRSFYPEDVVIGGFGDDTLRIPVVVSTQPTMAV
ncbi:hypothetical protein HMPREF9598_01742 [Cutibacterium acnes HL050PA1]|nr:hypothetical protein HMPREF9598_01742 [Cutibacterium acnes HL050PA1]